MQNERHNLPIGRSLYAVRVIYIFFLDDCRLLIIVCHTCVRSVVNI
jgi:hypothetical protein